MARTRSTIDALPGFMTKLLAPLPEGEALDETRTIGELAAAPLALAMANVDVAHATSELFTAQIRRVRLLQGDAAATAMYREAERHWTAFRMATEVLARTPARTREQLRMKVGRIGKVWLTAEGRWYDSLRAGVAVDEAWIAANLPAPKRGRAKA
jgi:hypothetical protein